MVGKLQILQQLRSRIPDMPECIPGCTQCCGHTAWSKFEWDLLTKEERESFDQFSFKCSFCKHGKCSIHDNRPIICRMIGVVDADGMRCPRGVVSSNTISKMEADFLGIKYVNNFFKGESQ